MYLKFFQRGFSIFIFSFSLFFACFSNAAAQEPTEHEIVLERYGNTLYSQIIEESNPFYSVGLKLDQPIEGLMVNFDPLNGGVWESVADYEFDEWPLFTSPTHTVRFKKKVQYDESQLVIKAHFLFIEEESGPETSSGGALENLYSGPEVVSADVRLISRREWGADENLRYWTPEIEELFKSNGNEKDYVNVCADIEAKYKNEITLSRTIKYSPAGEHLIWSLAYPKKVSKFILHHTDSELRDLTGDSRLDGRDYRAMIRAIYYYHAITRGWGDIGYNYIIDPLGNVYQGRYGGEKVIGAHARCYNNGSIGISVIGDYETRGISEPAFNSLVSLVAKKAKLHNIDPEGYSVFRGRRSPNIIGHKDVGNTSCPGKKFYSMFPKIRQRSGLAVRSGVFQESTINVQTLDYNAQLTSSLPTISLRPNERKKVILRFKNTGKKVWDRNTWLHVVLNNKENVRIVPVIEGKNFVAADMREKSVNPGYTATFEVELEAGYQPLNYTFEVAPVANGRYKISRSAAFIPIEVQEPVFGYSVVRKNLPSGIIFQGQKVQASIKLKNTGNISWFNYGDNPIRMGTERLRDRRSRLVKKHTTRLAHLLESEVGPGETGTFLFSLEAPLNFEGKIQEYFSPVIEGVHWLENKGFNFEVIVKKPIHSARIVEKTRIPTMLPGEMKKIKITMENRGDLAWEPDNMKTNLLWRGVKLFKKKLVPLKTIKPRDTVDFDFWVQAPYEEGRHRIFLSSKFNRVPIKGGSARFLIDVPKPRIRAQRVSQTPMTVNLKPGEEKEIEVKFKNIGNVVWRNKGTNTIFLAPSAPQDRLSKFYHEDSWENKYRAGKLVETEVGPGEIGTFRFKIKSNRRGIYRETFQLVVERVGWLQGSFVRWDFNVSGSAPSSPISSTKDAEVNQASVILKTNTQTPTETEPQTPKITFSTSSDLFRVRLSYADNNSEVTTDKHFQVFDRYNNILFDVEAGNPVEVRHSYGNIHVQLGDITKSSDYIRIVPDDGGVVEILSMERRPSWNNDLNDNRFRGVLEIRSVNSEAAFINELPLEDYLKGLAEVSNGTLSEKQKTIAILARTYARFYMSDTNRKFPGLPYDGSDDPAIFQRYLGYGYEIRSPNFITAVAATKNKVVTYNGELIKTPYFTQSDGRTLSAKETWGWTHTPYLQSVPDPYCEGVVRRGHGVGLSGLGAEGMAKEGKMYDEIIKYYYQGVEIDEINF